MNGIPIVHFLYNDLIAWGSSFFLIFCRISAFIAATPIFYSRLIPKKTKILFIFVLSFVVNNILSLSIPQINFANVFLLIVEQILIGVLMGFAIQILFQICIVAGQIIAIQNGLGFSSQVDPVNGINVVTISQFYLILTNLLFLFFDGHLMVIKLVLESFWRFPVTEWVLQTDDFYKIVEGLTWCFKSAVLVALPAMVAMLIVNTTFGIMGKTAPQMNIFSLGFSFNMIFGLFFVMFSLEDYAHHFPELLMVAVDMVRFFK